MKELWLNYEDQDGEPKRVPVEQDTFVIGRHSGCDLSVRSGRLSREHARINRFGDIYVISDCNSSNGTFINGTELSEPATLGNGDSIDLGGGLQLTVEIPSEEPVSGTAGADEDNEDGAAAAAGGAATAATAASVSGSAGTGGGHSAIPTSFFILGPILGLVILLCAGGGLFIAYSDGDGGSQRERAERTEDDLGFSEPDEESPVADDSPTDAGSPDAPGPDTPATVEPGTDPPNGDPAPPADTPDGKTVPDGKSDPPPVKPRGEKDRVRVYSRSFLTRTVANDPRAFLLDRQLEILVPQVAQLKSSPALAGNISQVNKNAAEIGSIATDAGLKPDFLAAAAVAKLGTRTGDVVATAREMAPVLQKLKSTLGMESADEAALVIAAYYQGEAGNFTKMRTTIEVLSGNNPRSSARQVRTIWFVNQNGKLQPNEFALALRFLAAGTIMQKPDEFNVTAEPVRFN